MNIYPYVYRIDHPSGEFYIGYRCANQVPAGADIGYKYKTSTKHLSYPFEEYSITILAEFFTATAKTDALDFKQATIYEHWGNPFLVNKRCNYNGQRFSTAGTTLSSATRQKMSTSRRGVPRSEETKAKIREANLGKSLSDEHLRKISIGRRGKGTAPKTAEHKRKISESLLGTYKTR